MDRALTIAAESGRSDAANPLHGFSNGVFELALRFRGDADRLTYAVQIEAEIWAMHAFEKKSKTGIRTSKAEVGLGFVGFWVLRRYLIQSDVAALRSTPLKEQAVFSRCASL